MALTPGRAVFNPDETLKVMRQPRALLSPAAKEFVPRPVNDMHAHQQQYLNENYSQYTQPETNGDGGIEQQQYQQQHQQQTQHQAMTSRMGSLNIGGSVQDRLRNFRGPSSNNASNNAAGDMASSSSNSASSNSTFFPPGSSYGYQQNNQQFHRNNKNYQNHHHSNNQNHHNSHNNYSYNRNNSHQSRYNSNHNNSQNHSSYHSQRQQQQQNKYSNQQQSTSGSGVEMSDIALDFLQSVIQCLNQNPGQFDTLATNFITVFEGLENDHFVLSIAMEDIFQESVRNSNFRYMGAKLYNLLHSLNPSPDSMFHEMLKAKLKYHQQEMSEYIQNNQLNKVREVALFLAELYMQLRHGDSRLQLLAQNIVYSLQQLLEHVINENVRCICLTLKLAGYDLSSDCPQEMIEIIAKLDRINAQNPGKFPLASNVIALQKNNWGRQLPADKAAADSAKAASGKPAEPLRVSDDPVFYGPDGREITAEECEFLTADNTGSTDNEEELDLQLVTLDPLDNLDPAMDEESARDYRLFLQQMESGDRN